MHRETGLIPCVCSIEGGQIVFSGGGFAFCFWLALAFCPCLCVLDEGDVVSLIECGKCEVLEESFTSQRNQFYPVGVCTRQAVRELLQDAKHRLAALCRTGSPNISKKDRILRRQRRAILSCSVQIGLGPLSSRRVHPAKQQESLHHTRSTERPVQCPPWAPQARGCYHPPTASPHQTQSGACSRPSSSQSAAT